MKKTLRVLSMFLALMMLMMSCGLAEVLRYGKEGDEVAKLQAALTELNYYKGEIDGKFGKQTVKAVQAFQKDAALKVDGRVGDKTKAKLTDLTGLVFAPDEEPTPDPVIPTGLFKGDYRTMQFGTAGDRVRVMQRALVALGFSCDVDGDFKSDTHAAVKAFQRIVGLTQDGKAGKKTLQKLENYFNDKGECISGPIAGNKPADPEPDPNAPVYGVPERKLRFGDTGLDVKFAMQRLRDLGFYTKKVDEKFGAGMMAAVKAFQRKNSLTADGVLGPKSLEVLFSDAVLDADDLKPVIPEQTGPRILKKGCEGEDVKTVQACLIALGYYTGKLDGKYGNGTYNAVRLFQARNALKVDGKVGPKTLEKMEAVDAVPNW